MKGKPQNSHKPPRPRDDNKDPWWEEALCARVDPELFFPPKGSDAADAKRVCRHCQVTEECGEYAAKHNEPYGVWGGETWTERRTQRRKTS